MAADVWQVVIKEDTAGQAGDPVGVVQSTHQEYPALSEVPVTVALTGASGGDAVQEGERPGRHRKTARSRDTAALTTRGKR